MGTIAKALNLLNFFSENAPELGLMDFKNLSGQDKATVYRHLTELEANGFLEQNEKTRKYRLGAAIVRLSSIRERSFPTRRIVSEWIDRLAEEVQELVHASLIQRLEMSPLYFCDKSRGATRVNFSEAEMLPLHATASGLAALAFGPPSLLEKLSNKHLAKYSNSTPTNFDTLKTIVGEVCEKGFSFSNQSYEEDVCSFGVPFFEAGPYACGTIAIAIPATRLDSSKAPFYTKKLWEASKAVSRELGGNIPEQLENKWRHAA